MEAIEKDGHTLAEMATCWFCRFYHHGEGECRRRSPSHNLAYQMGDIPGHVGYMWPSVSKDDFCGEFERGAALAVETVEQQKQWRQDA